eukprot:gene8413-18295_t
MYDLHEGDSHHATLIVSTLFVVLFTTLVFGAMNKTLITSMLPPLVTDEEEGGEGEEEVVYQRPAEAVSLAGLGTEIWTSIRAAFSRNPAKWPKPTPRVRCSFLSPDSSPAQPTPPHLTLLSTPPKLRNPSRWPKPTPREPLKMAQANTPRTPQDGPSQHPECAAPS